VTSSSVDNFSKVADTLSPPAVSQFLAANNWELEKRQPEVKEVWRLPHSDSVEQARIMLPLATDYADFKKRFSEVLHALAQINDWDPDQLLERIIATRADIFFIRLDQESIDGTIPFRQAEKSIAALYSMMKAAATTAANPLHSHRGRRPAIVTEFLDEDIRFGHTKRSSFIFTVVARLGDAMQLRTGEAEASFSRQVMETLARGLETTRDVSQSWDPGVLSSPGSHGISGTLVESVETLAESDTLRSLAFSFAWAVAEPRPSVGSAPIVLDRNLIAALPEVRERLVRQEAPPRRETLVGRVRALSRDEGDLDEDESATIQLVAEVQGRDRTVHINLAGEDHEWAITAYRNKLPFVVTGDLVYERRAWRLTGEIEVDPSFLRHRLERNPRAYGES
jgi:hypothetical protein